MDTKIVVDEAFLAKLHSSSRPAEICDAAGQPVGVLVPTSFYEEMIQAWAESQISPKEVEENRRCADEGKVKSSADVRAYLEAMDRNASTAP